jgi:4-hydroxybenzoate polyprenyltransferase
MSTLAQIARFVRWRDWGPGKLSVFWCLCLYIAVAYDLPFDTFALTFIVFMAFAFAQSALGYVLNNWGDRELDRRQFKNNPFNGQTRLESTLALTLTGLAAFVAGLPLILHPGFALLWITWTAAAAAYSLEPVRLKTKGMVGLVVALAAQWFLPVLLAFSAFEVAGNWDMWFLALALTVSGAALEIGRQRYDRSRDLLAHVDTFATSLPDVLVNRVFATALLLDKLSIGLVLVVVVSAFQELPPRWSSSLTWSIVGIYALLLLVTLGDSLRSLRGNTIDDPYYSQHHTAAWLLHETLLNFMAPVSLGIAASVNDPLFAVFLGLFLVWRVSLISADRPLRFLRSLRTK